MYVNYKELALRVFDCKIFQGRGIMFQNIKKIDLFKKIGMLKLRSINLEKITYVLDSMWLFKFLCIILNVLIPHIKLHQPNVK